MCASACAPLRRTDRQVKQTGDSSLSLQQPLGSGSRPSYLKPDATSPRPRRQVVLPAAHSDTGVKPNWEGQGGLRMPRASEVPTQGRARSHRRGPDLLN